VDEQRIVELARIRHRLRGFSLVHCPSSGFSSLGNTLGIALATKTRRTDNGLTENSTNRRRMRARTRLTYQEQSLEELNDVLTDQQSRLARLEQLAGRLDARLVGIAEQLESDASRPDDKPPHY